MIVKLICTGRGTHDPEVVYRYDGPVPVPEEWTFYARKSELDLNCRQCPQAPRPGHARLRALINAAAGHASRTLDISFANL